MERSDLSLRERKSLVLRNNEQSRIYNEIESVVAQFGHFQRGDLNCDDRGFKQNCSRKFILKVPIDL